MKFFTFLLSLVICSTLAAQNCGDITMPNAKILEKNKSNYRVAYGLLNTGNTAIELVGKKGINITIEAYFSNDSELGEDDFLANIQLLKTEQSIFKLVPDSLVSFAMDVETRKMPENAKYLILNAAPFSVEECNPNNNSFRFNLAEVDSIMAKEMELFKAQSLKVKSIDEMLAAKDSIPGKDSTEAEIAKAAKKAKKEAEAAKKAAEKQAKKEAELAKKAAEEQAKKDAELAKANGVLSAEEQALADKKKAEQAQKEADLAAKKAKKDAEEAAKLAKKEAEIARKKALADAKALEKAKQDSIANLVDSTGNKIVIKKRTSEEILADLADFSTGCADLQIDSLVILKSTKSQCKVHIHISNIGTKSMNLHGTKKGELDNIAWKAYLSGDRNLNRGDINTGGAYITKVTNDGQIDPGTSIMLEATIDTPKRTRYTSVLVIWLDALQVLPECNESNNYLSVILH